MRSIFYPGFPGRVFPPRPVRFSRALEHTRASRHTRARSEQFSRDISRDRYRGSKRDRGGGFRGGLCVCVGRYPFSVSENSIDLWWWSGRARRESHVSPARRIDVWLEARWDVFPLAASKNCQSFARVFWFGLMDGGSLITIRCRRFEFKECARFRARVRWIVSCFSSNNFFVVGKRTFLINFRCVFNF